MLTPQDCEDIESFQGRLWGRINGRRCSPELREAHDVIEKLKAAYKARDAAYEALAEAHNLCHPKIAQLEAQISHPLTPQEPSQPE